MAKCVSVFLIAVLLGEVALAGGDRAVNIRWADLGGLITGKSVLVSTTDGARFKGRVRAVEADAISFDEAKTPRLNRSAIAEIRLTDYVGNGRHIGKFAGGALGLTFGLVGGAVIGLRENSAHKDRDKVLAVTLMLGGLPAGLGLGYLLGRQADKEVTVIRIIPQ